MTGTTDKDTMPPEVEIIGECHVSVKYPQMTSIVDQLKKVQRDRVVLEERLLAVENVVKAYDVSMRKYSALVTSEFTRLNYRVTSLENKTPQPETDTEDQMNKSIAAAQRAIVDTWNSCAGITQMIEATRNAIKASFEG